MSGGQTAGPRSTWWQKPGWNQVALVSKLNAYRGPIHHAHTHTAWWLCLASWPVKPKRTMCFLGKVQLHLLYHHRWLLGLKKTQTQQENIRLAWVQSETIEILHDEISVTNLTLMWLVVSVLGNNQVQQSAIRIIKHCACSTVGVLWWIHYWFILKQNPLCCHCIRKSMNVLWQKQKKSPPWNFLTAPFMLDHSSFKTLVSTSSYFEIISRHLSSDLRAFVSEDPHIWDLAGPQSNCQCPWPTPMMNMLAKNEMLIRPPLGPENEKDFNRRLRLVTRFVKWVSPPKIY